MVVEKDISCDKKNVVLVSMIFCGEQVVNSYNQLLKIMLCTWHYYAKRETVYTNEAIFIVWKRDIILDSWQLRKKDFSFK